MASIVNGFAPIVQWFGGWFGHRAPSQVPTPPVSDAPKPADPEQTGNQATAGFGAYAGWGESMRGTPATYRQMRRMPTLSLVRSVVLNALDAGSWSVEADEDAPAAWKELVEQTVLPHRAVLIEHAASSGLDYGAAGFELVPRVQNGLTVLDYPKPLRFDAMTIWTEPGGKFLGLSTSADKNHATGPTITGSDCMLWTYDGEPGELYGRSRMENVRETASKWVEVQNRIGMLINKESGTATKVTYPPDDISKGAQATATTFAQNLASGSAYLAVESVLAALTPAQRRSASVDQIIALLAQDLWGIENVSTGGNGPAITACQMYAAYLDVQAARGYLQPERGMLEGVHGTKAEAGSHGDTGTMDCESIERKIVQRAVNPFIVDAMLVANFGPKARGKVRIVAHPLRDVQEAIDTMVIGDLFTNATTADEMFRNYDVDVILERRGIQKRKTPLPPKPVAPQPGVNGKQQPLDANDKSFVKLAASRFWGEDE